ncbi:MAG: adenosyl-hopene transferase HpnH [Elusimicrobiota bacterium]|jgi:hopanoid biosynthesis associated radical SAM protein HpnH
MALSLLQNFQVGAYVMKHRFLGTKRFPLVLMLEPLFRCNLACSGCGKIQYPVEILKKDLTVDECIEAIEACGAPVVSIAGGEPLLHPEMPKIVAEYVKRKKFVYLCTNALLLERRLKEFVPSAYLTFSIHLDGLEKRHDELVCREGTFKAAVSAIRTAKAAGFRVTTNTTVFEGEKPEDLQGLFDYLTNDLKIDGMTISPGYAYQKAQDQEHFLRRERTRELFRQILKPSSGTGASCRPRWPFNHSSFFLEFLTGGKEYACTPWGNPTRNVFGWQKPCYLMSDGHTKTYQELMDTTDWDRYGTGKDPRCADCMAHCGYEPTAVLDATSGPAAMWRSLKDSIYG